MKNRPAVERGLADQGRMCLSALPLPSFAQRKSKAELKQTERRIKATVARSLRELMVKTRGKRRNRKVAVKSRFLGSSNNQVNFQWFRDPTKTSKSRIEQET